MNIAAFASGRGSNLAAVLARIDDGSLRGVRVRLAISNNSRCGALDLARGRRIPVLHLSSTTHPDPEALADAMLEALEAKAIGLIVLVGYMKRLPARVVAAFPRRILNIHPALLPRHGGMGMYGIRVHRAVLAAGEKESGATVHYVSEDYDEGPIIRQSRVPVWPADTAETLAERVLAAEHDLLWRVIDQVVRELRR